MRDNYYVSEVRLDGVRASNGSVDISKNASSELIFTLSPGGEVQGSVVDKQGQPVKLAEGLLLPDPLPEIIPYYQHIYAEATGRFTINGVPPGSYRIYLWEGVEPARFFDRELLLQFAGAATQVRVERGSQVSARVLVITP